MENAYAHYLAEWNRGNDNGEGFAVSNEPGTHLPRIEDLGILEYCTSRGEGLSVYYNREDGYTAVCNANGLWAVRVEGY